MVFPQFIGELIFHLDRTNILDMEIPHKYEGTTLLCFGSASMDAAWNIPKKFW